MYTFVLPVPKGKPMVHGELASRRPGCILGGVAPQQRESLAVLLSRLRSDSPCTIGSPFEFPSYSYSDSPFFCPEGEHPPSI